MSDQEQKKYTSEVTESCRVAFTNDELLDRGKQLAEAQGELRKTEDDFTAVKKEWNSRVAAVEANITKLAGDVSRGYEVRFLRCIIVMDTPEKGMKECRRKDNGERVWVREMSGADFQMQLEFADGEERKNPPPPDTECSGYPNCMCPTCADAAAQKKEGDVIDAEFTPVLDAPHKPLALTDKDSGESGISGESGKSNDDAPVRPECYSDPSCNCDACAAYTHFMDGRHDYHE